MKEYHISRKFKIDWQKKILNWYSINKRQLPWREKKYQNFYNIWISEIMLQQTSVKTVIPYYEKFMKKWPSLQSFSTATLDEILIVWQGLGYYQRAKNLYLAKEELKKKDCIQINIQNLKELPGVGDYVASAICAILKDDSCVVVDGNIKRIISRAFNLSDNDTSFKKKVLHLATELTPKTNNKFYCQSLMDMANIICLPKKPNCSNCPVETQCLSSGNVQLNKRKKIEKVKKFGIAFIIKYENFLIIEKSKNKLLENLFCFPMTDFHKFSNERIKIEKISSIATKWLNKNNLDCDFNLYSNSSISHIFSHFRLNLFLIEIKLKNKKKFKDYEWIEKKDLKNRPVSKMMSKIIKEKI